jgi:hypothetical protein
MTYRSKPQGFGIDGVLVYKVFYDIPDRINYFSLHPEELANGMYVYISDIQMIQLYDSPSDSWIDSFSGSNGYWIFVKP